MTLDVGPLLDYRIKQSQAIIDNALRRSALVPLIVNFSGGKDSLVLLDLVQQVTDRFICMYMKTGIEFSENIQFVTETADSLQVKLLVSTPADYKGGFFERLETFGYWPTIKKTWCSRDLKFRAQKKLLNRMYGKTKLFKLNGVRASESARRTKMHRNTPKTDFMKPDWDVHGDVLVYPILNWTDENISDYLKINKIRVKKNPLYAKYGVSGCYWCPFYQASIYEKIAKQCPRLYDKFIEWEKKLNEPSVNGYQWLSTILSKR
jgi:phosphoadenosine phosphosulfate reductase